MKKAILGSLAVLTLGVSLNAAVYATVNGEEVTSKDVAALLRGMKGATYEALQPEQKKQVVNQAIERKLLAKEAMNSGIDKDPEFKKTLDIVKKDLALELWMKRKFEDIKVSDSEAKKYFDDNKAKFVQPKSAKAKHILLKTEEEAKAIIKELKGLKGEKLTAKFVELAKTKSTGPSGANGGDLGWFNAKQMVKPFSDATFAQNKGEVTKSPVKTQFGFHVILTEDKKGGDKVKFEDAKKQILGGLKMEKFREELALDAKKLRKKAKIVVN